MKIKNIFAATLITFMMAVAFLFVATIGATQTFAQGTTIYNGIPNPLPGNLLSQPFEAQQVSEFGDHVQFTVGSGRNLLTVTQTMSSFGCESGHWNSGDCVTTPGATFSHPITLNIYNVGTGGAVGTPIGSVTQTFAIPYRPSASPICGDGRWSDGTACYNGYAFNITFNLSGLIVPDQVIYGIAYNTTHYGYAPIGESAPCYTSPGSCGYDSLNVALAQTPPTVGTDPAPSDAYINSHSGLFYCDGGIGGIDIFRLDAVCWTGFNPAVKFTAAKPATNADQCKNGGWQTYTRPDGSTFKNQGDCVSFTKNGK